MCVLDNMNMFYFNSDLSMINLEKQLKKETKYFIVTFFYVYKI